MKEITLHKSQGVNIGLGKDWDTVVITLLSKHITNQLGAEIGSFSRTTTKKPFHIQDDNINGVTVKYLKAIGWSKAYDEIRNFEKLLWKQAEKYRLTLFHK